MKKSLFVLFALIVLICAVACSSSPKDTGIRIFANTYFAEKEGFAEKEFVIRYDLVEDATALETLLDSGKEDEIEAYMESLSKKEFTGAELLEGPVTLVLEPSVYYYEISDADERLYFLTFKVPTKEYHGADYFVVTDGEFIDYDMGHGDR